MRFRYQAYPVRGARSKLENVWRPAVDVRVIGPSGDETLTGSIDTGADDTLLPDFLISSLGIALDPDDIGKIEGIDGSEIDVRYATVDLELFDPTDSSDSYRWTTRVGFHARRNTVFGLTGFLEHFIAQFNGRTREVLLLPLDRHPLTSV